MKHLVAVILVMSLLCSSLAPANASETDFTDFDCSLTATMDRSVSGWTSTEEARALFTWCILFDCLRAGCCDAGSILPQDADCAETYVVVCEGSGLIAIIPMVNGYSLALIFAPDAGCAAYITAPMSAQELAEAFNGTKIYHTSASVLGEVGQQFVSALQSN